MPMECGGHTPRTEFNDSATDEAPRSLVLRSRPRAFGNSVSAIPVPSVVNACPSLYALPQKSAITIDHRINHFHTLAFALSLLSFDELPCFQPIAHSFAKNGR